MVARSVQPWQRRPAAAARSLAIGLLGTLSAIVPPAFGRLQDPPYPSNDSLRELQQLVFACGRENSSAPCEQARRQADSLLDHPRLPGSCKDILWQVREQAVVATTNNFSRRDRLDNTGRGLMRLCQERRQQPKAPSPAQAPGRGPAFSPGQER
jgi:hypothetical protein